MKKTLLLGLVISMALGVTACSTDNKGNSGSSESIKQEGQNNESKDTISKDSEYKDKKFIYGKVKSIVGNEIEFELAKDPEKDIEGVYKEETDDKGEVKEEIAAAITTPSTEAIKEGEENKVSVGEIEKNEPLIELEFTGDIKTMIIPTGTDINILSAKSGEGLSVIKEGTYLMISVDDNTSENPKVLSVDVIS